MKILFLHGWQSIPGGVKPTFLAQRGHEVINPRLRGARDAMRKQQTIGTEPNRPGC
jgi:hypothetical protein